MMASLFLLAAAEEVSANPLTVDGGLILWTWLIFGLLLILLKKTAWPQILQAVRERGQRLEAQIEDAERNRAEAAALLEEHKRLLAGGRAEAQEIVARGKAAGEKERAAILARAREEQESLLERARKEIAAERDKALVALRREAVEIALSAATRLVEKNLDSAANRRLVTSYLADIAKQS